MCQESSSEDLIDRHLWLLFSRGKIIELLTEYNHRGILVIACLGEIKTRRRLKPRALYSTK